MLLDQVPEVVDGQQDAADAAADQVQHDAFQDRPPGDRQHRLGNLVGERTEPAASAAGHHHRPAVPLRAADHAGAAVQAEQMPFTVDDRDLLERAGAHEIEDLGSAAGRLHRHGRRLRQRRGRGVQVVPVEHRAQRLPLPHHPEQPLFAVDHQDARAPFLVDHLECLAQGGPVVDQHVGELTVHVPLLG